MSPVTAEDHEEVGGSFLGWKFPCSCSFFQVALMAFLIDLEEDEAAGGSVVLLLTLITFHCPYTISFSLFSFYLHSLLTICYSKAKAKVSVPYIPCLGSELIPGAATFPSDQDLKKILILDYFGIKHPRWIPQMCVGKGRMHTLITKST